MKLIQIACLVSLCAAELAWPGAAGAQAPPATPPPGPVPIFLPAVEITDQGKEVVRVGRDYTLRAGETTGQVTVVLGSATIDGHVNGDVVVVLGLISVASTAVIDGSLVVVGGDVNVADGAVVSRDFVVVGGAVNAPDGFSPGGEHFVLGLSGFGGKFQAVLPWLTRGLLWGRPVVPELPWIWSVIGAFFLVYLALNVVFARPVRACSEILQAKPLSALLVGVLVMLLIGPVCLLLAVSVVGLAVIPFVLCALLVAGLLGKVAVARWAGANIVRQDVAESLMQSLRSFTIGFAAIVVAYMIPLLGFAAFTLVGVLGLGAAMLAFTAEYRRENPAPPPRVEGRSYARAATPIPDIAAVSASANPVRDGAYRASEGAIGSADASGFLSFPHAGFLERAAAFALDVILVLFAREILDLSRQEGGIFLLLLAYHVGFWTWKGTTVGGIICQLRVVRVDGAPLQFVDALVRGLSSFFSLIVAGIGCLWILKDPERQAWHDKIAGTYVVKVPRNFPL
jgi:uncharacterized RDD family membrane protein YckC